MSHYNQNTAGLPVLNRLRCGRGAQLGHEDSHYVEEENEIDLWENQTQRDEILHKDMKGARKSWFQFQFCKRTGFI